MEVIHDQFSIVTASAEGKLGLLKECLKQGFDPCEADVRGRTGLHVAAARGRDDILEVLLGQGADVMAVDHLGNTPLHYCGHIETIQCLAEYGADTTARNFHGDTPLKLMKRRGVEAAALHLLQQLISEAKHNNDQSYQPLLGRKPNSLRSLRQGLHIFKTLWFEFCEDLGAIRISVILLLALVVSLYVAYIVTGLSRDNESKIPINVDNKFVDF